MNKNDSFIKKIYTKRSVNRINKKIKLLGSYNTLKAVDFLNTRLISTLALFFVILIFKSKSYIYAPLFSIIYYFGLEYVVLDMKIKKRGSKLDYEALFFFEVLTLSIETGKNLKGALELTANNIDSEISDEFKAALKEVDYGKTLSEAINNMKSRIPSDTINNVLLNISQCSVYGTSIVETTRSQVDFLRDKKLLEVKGNISKMPVKVSVISVLFFVPLILLLILGPIIINFIG